MKKALPFIVIFLGIGLGATAFIAIRSIQESDIEPSVTRQVAPEPELEPATDTARYRVTFSPTWSSETHPDTLPGGAHVSPGVLVEHPANVSLFELGQPASAGVQEVAETGRTVLIGAELDELGLEYQFGSRIDVPGQEVFEVELDQTNSTLTFISMLAPSPDWFVGVEGLELFEFGQWVDSFKDIPLSAYDAGTDSGKTFMAANAATNPQDDVSGPVDNVFVEASAQIFGTLTVERL